MGREEFISAYKEFSCVICRLQLSHLFGIKDLGWYVFLKIVCFTGISVLVEDLERGEEKKTGLQSPDLVGGCIFFSTASSDQFVKGEGKMAGCECMSQKLSFEENNLRKGFHCAIYY